ncbi:MAG: DEAD/DEAH box helicase family protein, partial [Actinobacteria bacterium]|nr:DEAD/DEAH box helicase family protein [Actinomycetota bacterium]
MSVNIKFESNQDYQTEAIEAVTGLFEGLAQGSLGSMVGASHQVVGDGDMLIQDLVHANYIPGSIEFAELVQANIRDVQSRKRNSFNDEFVPIVPESMWKDFVKGEFPTEYSIEMETGTGKTYVYLRTAIELHLKYG